MHYKISHNTCVKYSIGDIGDQFYANLEVFSAVD